MTTARADSAANGGASEQPAQTDGPDPRLRAPERQYAPVRASDASSCRASSYCCFTLASCNIRWVWDVTCLPGDAAHHICFACRRRDGVTLLPFHREKVAADPALAYLSSQANSSLLHAVAMACCS